MLVDSKDEAELVAYLSAVAGDSGFVIPLFRQGRSNTLLVQQVGDDDRVEYFKSVNPKDIQVIDNTSPHLQRVGQFAIWGFSLDDGNTFFAERTELQLHLTKFIDEIKKPFLRLQVAQFCESDTALVDAWRKAFAHLAEVSPRSAYAWRDIVVIPAQIRLAIEQTIIAQGLDAANTRIDRDVKVEVQEGRIYAYLNRKLHTAIEQSKASKAMFQNSTALLCEAFGLSIDQNFSIHPFSDRQEEKNSGDEWRDTLIAAVGRGSISLVSQAIPHSSSRSHHLRSTPSYRDTRTVIFENGIPTHSYTDASADLFETKKKNYRLSIVVFQLEASGRPALETAAAYGRSYKSCSESVVAVITGIPEYIDGFLEFDFEQLAKECFDEVWILNDRSAYALQTLPYGPARSSSAACSNLSYLLRMFFSSNARQFAATKKKEKLTYSIITSAIGNRSISRLIDYCMMRSTHHTIDLSHSFDAEINIQGAPAEKDIAISSGVHRYAPQAAIKTSSSNHFIASPPRVVMMLSGLSILPSGEDYFRSYCIQKLKQYGWLDEESLLDKSDILISHRELQRICLRSRFISADDNDKNLRSRPKRGLLEDGILITNAMIRRRSFAINLLNGQVLIHCSRIGEIYRIYCRRYQYIMTYIQKEQIKMEKQILLAALDYVDCYCSIKDIPTLKGLAKLKIRDDDSFSIRVSSDQVTVLLDLIWPRGRAKHTEAKLGWASLILTHRGWSVEDFSIEGSTIEGRIT